MVAAISQSHAMETRQAHSYSRLPQSDTSSYSANHPTRWISFPFSPKILGIVLWTLLSISTGFALGTIAHTPHADDSYITLLTTPQTFKYNRIFAEIPSDESNKAWESLFPSEGGFFNISKISSKRSTLSVFHQLHCLDGIRHNYWNLYNTLHDNTSHDKGSMRDMDSPAHVRHCIDLLRQGLMCNADTTLELKEEEMDGVHGFGVLHQCSDWTHLLRIVSEKQAM